MALTFSEALFCKYREGQARDERGRFASEHGSSTRGKAPKSEADRLAHNREIARARGRTQRAKERAAQPKYRKVPRLISREGAHKAEQALRAMMTSIPNNHYDHLRNLRLVAVKEVQIDRSTSNITSDAPMAAYFSPWKGIVLAERANGRELLDLPSVATHEFGHALDYFGRSSDDDSYSISKSLVPVIRAELRELSEVQAYYAEHYTARSTTREIFAEVYSAMYTPNKLTTAAFFANMTRAEVLRSFPRTVAAIENLRF